MKQIRFKGVTQVAWVFIILGVIGALFDLDFREQIKFYGITLYLASVISNLAYLVCGFYLLRLKESARKAAVCLSFISFLLCPIYVYLASKSYDSTGYYAEKEKVILEKMKPEYRQEALQDLKRIKEATNKVMPFVIAGIVLVPFLLLDVFIIYFLTRPRVKEQFLKSEEVAA